MQVITAPEQLILDQPSVFLAGGITDCPNWQQHVISQLKGPGVIFNPRRANFPIHDPKAAEQQITWEFNALAAANIFSMWFCAGSSDQPIALYEYGRHLALYASLGFLDRVVIGVEPGYKREQDVRIQTALVNPQLAGRISDDLTSHVSQIQIALDRFMNSKWLELRHLSMPEGPRIRA